MGWSIGYGYKKPDVIRGLICEREWGAKDGVKRTGKTLAHCVRGNILWYVREITGEGLPPNRFIGCSILGTDGEGNWGSKDMEESSGPHQSSCPLSYLAMVPDPGHYATEWREGVRKYWANRKVGIKIGNTPMVLKVQPGFSVLGKTITEITVQRVGRRIMGYVNGMKVNVVPRRMLIGAEIVTA